MTPRAQLVPIEKMMTGRKHLSDIANDVLHKCALALDSTSVDDLVAQFESSGLEGDYSRNLVEFCCVKAIQNMCPNIGQCISDDAFNFSRFTFDMMLAWDIPMENVAKEKHDRKLEPMQVEPSVQDDISLFYSDIMPLLVDHQPSVGEEAFVWLASLIPLVADNANARFTFETLTDTTAKRLHFPAYNIFLKEIHKCILHLQTHAPPKGVELGDGEFILHVEGAGPRKVVRHIEGKSLPGRLTLTNFAMYFEASGVMKYEDAVKIDLLNDVEHTVRSSNTGPWDAQLFDQAIIYEAPELSEGVVLEFPEITTSTRREHWLALVKEIMLLHRFLKKFKVESPTQAWEMHSRTILGIIRLHAAKEMLRITPPIPTKFLIFSLFEELPKGDFVMQEVAEMLKNGDSGQACSASTILRNFNMSQSTTVACAEVEDEGGDIISVNERADNLSPLETVIDQTRVEAKEVAGTKASVEGMKEVGISESAMVLMELVSPLKSTFTWLQEVLTWKRPGATVIMATAIILIAYNEWIGKAIAALLLWIVAMILKAKQGRGDEKRDDEIVVCTASDSDKSTMESIASAPEGLNTIQDIVKETNIVILKVRSILIYRATMHAKVVMAILGALAIIVAVVPFKFIIIGGALQYFTMSLSFGKYKPDKAGDRRLKEWWGSIPISHVKIVDKLPESPS